MKIRGKVANATKTSPILGPQLRETITSFTTRILDRSKFVLKLKISLSLLTFHTEKSL